MTRVQKRCLKCGHVASVKPRQRKCYQQKFGKGSYACWGALVKVEAPATLGAFLPDVAGGSGARHTPVVKPQDVAEKKLAHARAQVTAKTKAMARLATSLRMWTARVKKYERAAAMSDAEIEAARKQRLDAADRRATARLRRGIELKKADV